MGENKGGKKITTSDFFVKLFKCFQRIRYSYFSNFFVQRFSCLLAVFLLFNLFSRSLLLVQSHFKRSYNNGNRRKVRVIIAGIVVSPRGIWSARRLTRTTCLEIELFSFSFSYLSELCVPVRVRARVECVVDFCRSLWPNIVSENCRKLHVYGVCGKMWVLQIRGGGLAEKHVANVAVAFCQK